jgi:hypothetical protein
MPSPQPSPADPLAALSLDQRLLVLEALLQDLPTAELYRRLTDSGLPEAVLPSWQVLSQVRASEAFAEAVARRRQYYERLLARQALWLLMEEAGVPEAVSNEWLFSAMERLQDLLGRCEDESTAARVSDSLARLRLALLSAARWRASRETAATTKPAGPSRATSGKTGKPAGDPRDLAPLADRLALLLGLDGQDPTPSVTPGAKPEVRP